MHSIMLARLQTLFLALTALLAIASSFLPFWYFSAGETILLSDFAPVAEAGIVHTITLYLSSVFSPLTALIALTAIVLFKNRKQQALLANIAMLLFVIDLLTGLTAAHFLNSWLQATMQDSVIQHAPGAGLFVICPEPLFLWLALKGIAKDEKIATAYKRL
ncbi:hypothetical protein Ptc2401_01611 [Prosthecochloris sp. CIB 2401]|nr:DUF4293 family protein [Prosthecochloris vibrioformis]ANT65355.1 hypothetical protein Ptc2401_01611 [Prosthecochloris sp. CIB 2401]